MHTIDELRIVLPALKNPTFAASLIAQSETRTLSDKQMYWVNKIVADASKPAAVTTNVGDLSAINALFDKARQHLKFPAIVMSVIKPKSSWIDQEKPEVDFLVRVNVAGQGARFPGSLNVTSGEKPAFDDRRTWFGRVHKDGNYEPTSNANPAITDRLVAFAADPVSVAAEHGRLTGRCCFCNKHLQDERSTAVGYGATCASHYGLPWGKA